jgi:predicted PurR-regulated permease PerM
MTLNKLFRNPNSVVAYASVIVGGYFLVMGLIQAKTVLAPVLMALVIAMLSVPLARMMEKKLNFKKVFASLLSLVIVMIVTIGISALVFFQFSNFVADSGDIAGKLEKTLNSVEEFIIENSPLEREAMEEFKTDYGLKETPNGEEGGNVKENQQEAMTVLGNMAGFLAALILTYVYVFLFIHYRKKFFNFLLKLFPPEKQQRVSFIVNQSLDVVQHYIVGRLILMVFLVILYGIGLMISGVENYILVSLIGAVLSIIPFIGNMIAYVIAIVIGLGGGGDTSMIMGVTITFLVVQIADSYIFQPLILGNKLNVNPFFIIFSVLVGNAIWGIVGMVLSIPLFAVVTIITNKVSALHAFGYLFRNAKEEVN